MVLISYFNVNSNSLPDDVHHVTEADILHGHFPREMLEQLHLVKRVTGLGEDEAAPGDDVAGGEADHGQGLLMMETGHPGLRLVTIRQQLGAETQTGDQDQGQAPDQGQPPASVTLGPGQGCQHTQHCLTHDPCCVITPLVTGDVIIDALLLSNWSRDQDRRQCQCQDTRNHPTPGPGSHR